MLQPPTVLHGPVVHGVEGLSPKRNLRHLWPAWVDECLPRNGDQVGLSLAQDVFGEEKFAQSLTLEDLHFLLAD